MKILVTGGAGFIGSHTVVELVGAGYDPVIVDNFTGSEKSVLTRLEKLLGRKIPCYEQDYQDTVRLNQVIKEENIGSVIHFAAYKQVGESVKQPLKYYGNNIDGLIKLLQLIDGLDSTVNFVFSSSCTIYGEPETLPVTEDSPVQPAKSPYGATKQMGEIILRDVTARSNLKTMALRYFNPIGVHPSGLIGELPIGVPANLVPFVTQTAAGLRKELTVYGDDYPTPDGSCIRDYIHVVDLAKAHVKALAYLEKQPANFYDFINIGTGKGSSVLEVIQTFEKVTEVKLPYKIGAQRDGDITATYAAVDKAKKVLGWRAEKTLADALADAWRWQQSISKSGAVKDTK